MINIIEVHIQPNAKSLRIKGHNGEICYFSPDYMRLCEYEHIE